MVGTIRKLVVKLVKDLNGIDTVSFVIGLILCTEECSSGKYPTELKIATGISPIVIDELGVQRYVPKCQTFSLTTNVQQAILSRSSVGNSLSLTREISSSPVF